VVQVVAVVGRVLVVHQAQAELPIKVMLAVQAYKILLPTERVAVVAVLAVMEAMEAKVEGELAVLVVLV
jgi:hypothetical protein